MTAGDRVTMSPKTLCSGSCDAHRLPILACVKLRDRIADAATLPNAPKQFQPMIRSASINETADWNRTRVWFGVVVRLHSVVRQGMPSPCSLR